MLLYLNDYSIHNNFFAGLSVVEKRKLLALSTPVTPLGTPFGSTFSLASTSSTSLGGYPGYPQQVMNYPYQMPHPIPYQHLCQPVYQQVPTPQTMSFEPQPLQQARSQEKIGFSINYVLCLELFTKHQDGLLLTNLNPEKDTVGSMIKMICARHKIDESLTLELFTKEGCALNTNGYTENCESPLKF